MGMDSGHLCSITRILIALIKILGICKSDELCNEPARYSETATYEVKGEINEWYLAG